MKSEIKGYGSFVRGPLATFGEIADAAYNLLDLKPGQVVYDLGCGYGRFLAIGAENFGLNGVGFEIEPNIARATKKYIQEQNLPIIIINDDFTSPKYWHHLTGLKKSPFQLRNADGLFLYLFPHANLILESKLKKELKPGTKIVSRGYKFSPDWRISQQVTVKPKNPETDLREAVAKFPNATNDELALNRYKESQLYLYEIPSCQV